MSLETLIGDCACAIARELSGAAIGNGLLRRFHVPLSELSTKERYTLAIALILSAAMSAKIVRLLADQCPAYQLSQAVQEAPLVPPAGQYVLGGAGNPESNPLAPQQIYVITTK